MLSKIVDLVDYLRVKITAFETFLLKRLPKEKQGFYGWENPGIIVIDPRPFSLDSKKVTEKEYTDKMTYRDLTLNDWEGRFISHKGSVPKDNFFSKEGVGPVIIDERILEKERCSKCSVILEPGKLHFRKAVAGQPYSQGDSVCEDCFIKEPLDYVVVCSC